MREAAYTASFLFYGEEERSADSRLLRQTRRGRAAISGHRQILALHHFQIGGPYLIERVIAHDVDEIPARGHRRGTKVAHRRPRGRRLLLSSGGRDPCPSHQ